MPYRTEWVEPEVYLEYEGVTIYHIYRDDEIDDPRTYWYTLDADASDNDGEEEGVFDIRDFAAPLTGLPWDLDTEDGRRGLMKELITAGIFGKDGQIHRSTEEEETDRETDEAGA